MDLVNKYMSSIEFQTVDGNTQVVDSGSVYSVTISGEVVNPGTYKVTKDSTLGHLISLAGGLNEKADITCFNSNSMVESGGSYYIPFISVDENNKSTKISLNTANQAALDTLPGIGEVFSKRIIEYRLKSGGFKAIEDLKKVNGIGAGLFESLKDLVCL
jgi:competence protein ComEA